MRCSPANVRNQWSYVYMFVFSRRADPKMAAFNSGFKLVSRLTMHDLKAVQDAFMVT